MQAKKKKKGKGKESKKSSKKDKKNEGNHQRAWQKCLDIQLLCIITFECLANLTTGSQFVISPRT